MLEEFILDFNRADPGSADFQHVIGAAAVPEVSVGILIIAVAGAKPIAGDGVFGFFVLVPIASARGVGLDDEVPHRSGRDGLIIFIDDAGFESWNDGAAGTRLHGAGTVRDEHVKSFSGTDGIENLHPETLFEAMKDGGRKAFTRRDSMANGGKIGRGNRVWRVSQQLCVVGGNREEECGSKAADHFKNSLR